MPKYVIERNLPGAGALSAAEPPREVVPVPARPAPLTFEINEGQVDGVVKFLGRHDGISAYLLQNELVLALGK